MDIEHASPHRPTTESSATTCATLTYPPLASDSRSVVDTETAAHHLNRKPQTLRVWACRQNGPLQPTRINGRLAWSVRDLRRLTGDE